MLFPLFPAFIKGVDYIRTAPPGDSLYLVQDIDDLQRSAIDVLLETIGILERN